MDAGTLSARKTALLSQDEPDLGGKSRKHPQQHLIGEDPHAG